MYPLLEIFVNGEAKQVPAEISVFELLTHIGLDPERVAVEMNREIVRKREWRSTQVPERAQIEIVEFVGGG